MTAPVMPEPDGGWRSRRARRKAERAWARDLDTGSKARAAGRRAADRKAGRTEDPLSWPMRLLTTLVAVVVLAVASVIALVVVAGQIPFYDLHLTVKNVDLSGIGIAWEPNLPTFTPMATEGLVLACTLMAITLVLLNRTSALWTQAMWFFAGVAAFVNTWHMVSEMGDLFGGILRGGLSLANPFLVHLFVLWCRHLRTGRTLEQARIESAIHWRGVAGRVTAVLFVVLQHVRHPPIALRAFGYWLGIPGWDYRSAWQAASIGYRARVQEQLDTAVRNTADRDHGGDQAAAGDATTGNPASPPNPAPVAAGDQADDAVADGTVMVAERPAFDEAEIARLVAQMNDPNFGLDMVTDQRGSTTTSDDHGPTTTASGRRPRGPVETTTDSEPGDHDGDHSTTSGRPARRPRRIGGRGQKVAGRRAGGRAKPAPDVDISDVLPAARKVASKLGDGLRREALLKGLREDGHRVGGQRRDALWEAIKAERDRPTGQ